MVSGYAAARSRTFIRKGLAAVNPTYAQLDKMWKKDQEELLDELLEEGYETVISGVFACPFDESWLGREITAEAVDELVGFSERYGINPAGEGGEIETTVLDAPFFKKRIVVYDHSVEFKANTGYYVIEDAGLVEK